MHTEDVIELNGSEDPFRESSNQPEIFIREFKSTLRVKSFNGSHGYGRLENVCGYDSSHAFNEGISSDESDRLNRDLLALNEIKPGRIFCLKK